MKNGHFMYLLKRFKNIFDYCIILFTIFWNKSETMLYVLAFLQESEALLFIDVEKG